jgi:hypothetical protein
MSKTVNAISNQLGEIRRTVSQVTNSPNLNAQQKRDIIKQLRDVERQILKAVDIKELRRLAQL